MLSGLSSPFLCEAAAFGNDDVSKIPIKKFQIPKKPLLVHK